MSWRTTKIVVRESYVSFDPLRSEASLPVELSAPVRALSSGEAIYAIIAGRPAGLFNFLMRFVGLSRRFEFVLSSTQVVVRVASTSSQTVSLSKLSGLNSASVGLARPIYQALACIGAASVAAAMAMFSQRRLAEAAAIAESLDPPSDGSAVL